MRPQGDKILNIVAMTLGGTFLPLLETEYAQSQMGLTMTLLGMVAQEFDRAAHRRIEENRELIKIFSTAVTHVKDENLKKRLQAAIKKSTNDYTVTALDKLNCELLEILIDLHAHIEVLEDEDVRKIEGAIWDELEKQVNRRGFTAGLGSASREADESEE